MESKKTIRAWVGTRNEVERLVALAQDYLRDEQQAIDAEVAADTALYRREGTAPTPADQQAIDRVADRGKRRWEPAVTAYDLRLSQSVNPEVATVVAEDSHINDYGELRIRVPGVSSSRHITYIWNALGLTVRVVGPDLAWVLGTCEVLGKEASRGRVWWAWMRWAYPLLTVVTYLISGLYVLRYQQTWIFYIGSGVGTLLVALLAVPRINRWVLPPFEFVSGDKDGRGARYIKYIAGAVFLALLGGVIRLLF